MSTIWILIILSSYGHVTPIEFSSKERCEVASKNFQSGFGYNSICVQY